jgi:hypothetical protein
MIAALLLSARLWFAALPRGAKLAIAAVVGVLLAWALWSLWISHHDAAVIDQHEGKIDAEVERKTGEASEAAADAAATTRSDVERGNDKARGAAAESDDPLADGLRALKEGEANP